MPGHPDATQLKGKFLVASPALEDPNFRRSVVCICEHTDEGSFGLVINRVYQGGSAADVFTELGMKHTGDCVDIPVYNGGPVSPGELFFLHGPPFNWSGCRMVNSSLAVTNTVDLLEAVAAGNGPRDFLIFLGYSGWGPGQLEMELVGNSWLTVPVDTGIVFNTPVEQRWDNAIKLMNITDPAFLSDVSGNA